jgi:EAL domain-containing protein (putative c-di-GMP-specific phosphodiesterase class I)
MDFGDPLAAVVLSDVDFKLDPVHDRLMSSLEPEEGGEDMERYATQTLQGPGLLYLRFENEAARERIANVIASLDLVSASDGDVLTVCAPEHDVLPLARSLSENLSALEQDAVRVIFHPLGRPLSLRDCFEIETLRQFLSRAQSGWFVQMLREGRLLTHFQPIVFVAEPNRVFAYEGLIRGCSDGGLVGPDSLFQVARGLRMNRELDGRARYTTIKSAARHQLLSKIFVNCCPASLDDPDQTLDETLLAVDEVGLKREQIVLEITESERIPDIQAFRRAMNRYRDAGFGVALDDLGAGYSSLRLLGELRPDYVKLDRDLMRGVEEDGFKAVIAQKVLETAQKLNIQTVAEGVETQGQWEWLRHQGGDFAQGFYFAPPASTPPVFSNNGLFWSSVPQFVA